MALEALSEQEIKDAEAGLRALEGLGKALTAAPAVLAIVRKATFAVKDAETKVEVLRGERGRLEREVGELQGRHDAAKADLDTKLATHQARVNAEIAEATRQATIQQNGLEEERQRILAELRNEQAKVEQIRRQAQVVAKEEDDRIGVKRLEVARELARLDEEIAAKKHETEAAREEFRKVNEAIDALARRGR